MARRRVDEPCDTVHIRVGCLNLVEQRAQASDAGSVACLLRCLSEEDERRVLWLMLQAEAGGRLIEAR